MAQAQLFLFLEFDSTSEAFACKGTPSIDWALCLTGVEVLLASVDCFVMGNDERSMDSIVNLLQYGH